MNNSNKKIKSFEDMEYGFTSNRPKKFVSKCKKCARCDKEFNTTRLRSLVCSDCWEQNNILQRESSGASESGLYS